MTLPIIKYSKIWLTISTIVVVLTLVVIGVWRLNLGIDFTGGTLFELSFDTERPVAEQVKVVLEEVEVENAQIQLSGEKQMIVRTKFLTEEQHQAVLGALRTQFQAGENTVREDRYEAIGAVISSQLRTRALWAIFLVSVGIILYVAYAFRKVSYPVASWKYGALAIVALLHDLFIVLGVFAVLGKLQGIEIDIGFVVALLTVLGYSVNDTIVVYDRTRENLVKRSADNFAETVNIGLNQTLSRSINTTLTTLLPLLALYFFGGATIHNFALALIIGILSGAYSSIFIASPLLVVVERWKRK
jgi:preprotein translocase subunit SecF